MIWNPTAECMPREQLRALQLERLRATLARVNERVPLYHQRLEAAGVDPVKPSQPRRDPARSLPDQAGHARPLPLRALRRPDGGRRSPSRLLWHHRAPDRGRLHPGRPGDLGGGDGADRRRRGGHRPDDIAHVAFGYGLFTGAFGLHYALERVGATVLPVSGGNTQRQVEIMRHFGSTVLVCTPSYALRIAEVAEEMGIKPGEPQACASASSARSPGRSRCGARSRSRLGVVATDNYGLSELIGPGISGECEERCGLHINEDLFLAEIIDSRHARAAA